MKITIVADVLGQENNGTTATIKRMMMGLVERGHQVTMVSPHKDDQSTNPKYITVKQRNFGIFSIRYIIITKKKTDNKISKIMD